MGVFLLWNISFGPICSGYQTFSYVTWIMNYKHNFENDQLSTDEVQRPERVPGERNWSNKTRGKDGQEGGDSSSWNVQKKPTLQQRYCTDTGSDRAAGSSHLKTAAPTVTQITATGKRRRWMFDLKLGMCCSFTCSIIKTDKE